MLSKKPKILITVDTEALPLRAGNHHVEKLIWGKHEKGTAGIAEICDVVENVGGRAVFFLDVAGSFYNLAEYRKVNSYLERRGHAVEWHYHPEILGTDFLRSLGVTTKDTRQDLYDRENTFIVLNKGLQQFIRITGRKPNAYRAGSFRANNHAIDFLGENEIPYSFNLCSETATKENYNTPIPKSAKPFYWENGVKEIPCGEINFKDEIVNFRYPRVLPEGLNYPTLAKRVAKHSDGLVNVLMHSWSLLGRPNDQQYYEFVDNTPLKNFEKLLDKLKSEYDFQNDVFI